ncbi:MAG: response regulator [Halioglobus sp.]
MKSISRFYQNHGTTMRIAMGQCSVLITLLLLAAFIGLIPDRDNAVIQGRASLAEAIAANSSIFITRADLRRMEANLRLVLSRNPDILSAAVRKVDESPIVTVGDHESHWLVEGDSNSQLSVPIWEGEKRWGQMELRFTPLRPQGPLSFFLQPITLLILFISVASFILFFLYLRKMLKDLDPSQAIPDRVRSALDTMAEGLLVLDAKQNIVLANEAFSTIVGIPAGKIIGQKAGAFTWYNTDESSMSRPDYPWSRALADCEAQRNQAVKLKISEGNIRTFQTNCSPVLANENKAGGVLISFDDITELEEKEQQLKKSKMQAEQANRAKSDFLANMSHEIRTPMTSIMGFTEVLKRAYSNRSEGDIDSHNLRHLDTIANSSEHLLGLINDILDLSKIEAGRVEVEQVLCSVHWIIHEVLQVMRVRAEEKGLTLEYVPDGWLPETIQSDPVRIRQILINLVGNAIKFTERGSVEIITSMDGSAAEPMLKIDVRDSGIGMTAGQSADVFSPFVQADSSITRRFGGTGLGLSICKRFSEAMGGEISVASEPGRGSTFSVLLPAGSLVGSNMLTPQQLLEDSQAIGRPKAGRWVFTPASVLVVDDGAENRELLSLVLEEQGLLVTTAENGREALDLLARETIQMVLMDVSMPVMDGYTAVAEMRERGMTMPVIALTAHAMKGAKERCLNAGYSGYLSKPIDFDALSQRLAEDLSAEFVADAKDSPTAETASVQIEPGLSAQESPALIFSSLPGADNKFEVVILRFVNRLREQIAAIQQAYDEKAYDALQDLGHWLRGSAGSVGFHDFDEPGQALEDFARQRDDVQLSQIVQQIGDLGAAVFNAYAVDHPKTASATVSQTRAVTLPEDDLPPVVTSEMMADERFRPLIKKYVQVLPKQLDSLEQAMASSDLQIVADLAHWLLGSAGTLGLHAFTEPASALQDFANAGEISQAKGKVEVIRTLCNRIDLTQHVENA